MGITHHGLRITPDVLLFKTFAIFTNSRLIRSSHVRTPRWDSGCNGWGVRDGSNHADSPRCPTDRVQPLHRAPRPTCAANPDRRSADDPMPLNPPYPLAEWTLPPHAW